MTDVTSSSAGMLLRRAMPSRTLLRDSGVAAGGTNPTESAKHAGSPAASALPTSKWKLRCANFGSSASASAAAAAVGLPPADGLPPAGGEAGAAAVGLRGCCCEGCCCCCCGAVSAATAASAMAAHCAGSSVRGRAATSSDAATCSCTLRYILCEIWSTLTTDTTKVQLPPVV